MLPVNGTNPAPACPALDHLACKIPGTLEPRIYDVYTHVSIGAGLFRQNQFVEIGNRDAPWHLAALGWHEDPATAPTTVAIRIYNSRGFGGSDVMVRLGNIAGGQNAQMPEYPSLVWPVNSSLIFDVQNPTAGPTGFDLFFFGFKIYDRGKAPC